MIEEPVDGDEGQVGDVVEGDEEGGTLAPWATLRVASSAAEAAKMAPRPLTEMREKPSGTKLTKGVRSGMGMSAKVRATSVGGSSSTGGSSAGSPPRVKISALV